MAKWLVTTKGGDYIKAGRELGISPITARLLRNRDIITAEDVNNFLNSDLRGLHDPHKLTDIDRAAQIMKDSIDNGDKIRIIGDYDVDGICSSYILYQGLKRCGGNVDVKLPHRIEDGYGLSMSMVDTAISDGIKTLITCDNGISAIEQIAHAKDMGMTVVVTDHHEVLKDSDDQTKMLLPKADAVVDPKRIDDKYPWTEICGAVVAYKFIQVLTELMGISDEADMHDFFSDIRIFAGIATVCDVMPLRDENRIFVVDSFRNIPDTQNVGLKALLRECEIDPYDVTCYIYGFVIGPCFNAMGRLDSAMRSLELLMENNPNAAAGIARELRSYNEERKRLTNEGQQAASDKLQEYGENLPDVLVIYLPDLHESLAGIIAGRIREATNRPVYVITDTADGVLKGSGRSIEAYHMHDALSACRDLLIKFGGHKMAAGFSLEKENLERFIETLNRNSTLTEEDFEETIHLDMELPLSYLSISLVREIDKLAPFGTGNEEPLFAARNVELIRGKIIGKNANVGKLQVCDEHGNTFDMMVFQKLDKFMDIIESGFGKDEKEKLFNGERHVKMTVKIAYYPGINEFRGTESLQIIMKDCKL